MQGGMCLPPYRDFLGLAPSSSTCLARRRDRVVPFERIILTEFGSVYAKNGHYALFIRGLVLPR